MPSLDESLPEFKHQPDASTAASLASDVMVDQRDVQELRSAVMRVDQVTPRTKVNAGSPAEAGRPRSRLCGYVAKVLPPPERYPAIEGPHAQYGEDTLLEQVFGDLPDGHCVEVGAYDGQTGSTTLRFERKGWTCLLIEPIPECVEAIRRHRACLVEQCAASSREGEETFFVAEHLEQMSTLESRRGHHRWISDLGGMTRAVTVRTARLDDLLDAAGFSEIQFITIDVEGHELEVLRGLSLRRFRPRIVIVEENRSRRASDVSRHMQANGYVNFKRTGVNDWYARVNDVELVQRDALRRFNRQKRILRLEQGAMWWLARTPAWLRVRLRAGAIRLGWPV